MWFLGTFGLGSVAAMYLVDAYAGDDRSISKETHEGVAALAVGVLALLIVDALVREMVN